MDPDRPLVARVHVGRKSPEPVRESSDRLAVPKRAIPYSWKERDEIRAQGKAVNQIHEKGRRRSIGREFDRRKGAH